MISRVEDEPTDIRFLIHLDGPAWVGEKGLQAFPADPFERSTLGRQHPALEPVNKAYKQLVDGF